jgi:hypothetical protein
MGSAGAGVAAAGRAACSARGWAGRGTPRAVELVVRVVRAAGGSAGVGRVAAGGGAGAATGGGAGAITGVGAGVMTVGDGAGAVTGGGTLITGGSCKSCANAGVKGSAVAARSSAIARRCVGGFCFMSQ